MPSPLNLAQGAVGQPRPQLLLAHVSTAKPAPASFTSPLYVTLPSRPDYFHTIASWPAMHGNTLPARGAACLLAFDDHRNLWCVSWVGTYS